MSEWEIRRVEGGAHSRLPKTTGCVTKPHDMDPSSTSASLIGQEDGQPVLEYPINGGGLGIARPVLTPLGERNAGDEVLIATGELDEQGRPRWGLFDVLPH